VYECKPLTEGDLLSDFDMADSRTLQRSDQIVLRDVALGARRTDLRPEAHAPQGDLVGGDGGHGGREPSREGLEGAPRRVL